jgi:hypothetical protein
MPSSSLWGMEAVSFFRFYLEKWEKKLLSFVTAANWKVLVQIP